MTGTLGISLLGIGIGLNNYILASKQKREPSTTGGSLVVFVQTSGKAINSITASISAPDMDGWMGCALYIF